MRDAKTLRDERGAETLWVRGKGEADTSWVRWEIIKKVRKKYYFNKKVCIIDKLM